MAYSKYNTTNRPSKPLDAPINVSRLDDGYHKVKVLGVDIGTIRDKGYFSVTFSDNNDRFYKENVYIREYRSDSYPYKFKKFVGAFGVKSTEFIKLIEDNYKNFEMFKNMVLRIKIGRKDGYQIKVDSGGSYLVEMFPTGEIITRELTFRAAKEVAESQNIKKSFRHVEQFLPWGEYANYNQELFDSYLKEKSEAERTNSPD